MLSKEEQFPKHVWSGKSIGSLTSPRGKSSTITWDIKWRPTGIHSLMAGTRKKTCVRETTLDPLQQSFKRELE